MPREPRQLPGSKRRLSLFNASLSGLFHWLLLKKNPVTFIRRCGSASHRSHQNRLARVGPSHAKIHRRHRTGSRRRRESIRNADLRSGSELRNRGCELPAGVPVFRIIDSSPGQLVCLSTNPPAHWSAYIPLVSVCPVLLWLPSRRAFWQIRGSRWERLRHRRVRCRRFSRDLGKGILATALLATSEQLYVGSEDQGVSVAVRPVKAMAEGKASFQEILQHYHPNANIVS